jgi:hypothetical protein
MGKLPESFESTIYRNAHELRRREMLHSVEEAVRAILGWDLHRGHAASEPPAARGRAPFRG